MEHGDKFLMVFNPEEIFEYIYIYKCQDPYDFSLQKKMHPQMLKKINKSKEPLPPKKKEVQFTTTCLPGNRSHFIIETTT